VRRTDIIVYTTPFVYGTGQSGDRLSETCHSDIFPIWGFSADVSYLKCSFLMAGDGNHVERLADRRQRTARFCLNVTIRCNNPLNSSRCPFKHRTTYLYRFRTFRLLKCFIWEGKSYWCYVIFTIPFAKPWHRDIPPASLCDRCVTLNDLWARII
jgi:hypothetical protein